jgi:hypothetical protein
VFIDPVELDVNVTLLTVDPAYVKVFSVPVVVVLNAFIVPGTVRVPPYR